MKVVCPECAHETEVPDDEIGGMGRRVRCAQCRHIWFQEPVVADDMAGFRRFDESMEIEPIPLSVHPDADVADEDDEDDEDDDGDRGPSFFKTLNYAYLGRMVAGFVVGCLLVGGALTGAASAGKAPPSLERIYAAFGKDVRVKPPLEVKDTKLIGKTLTGWIVNVSEFDAPVLPLDVTPVDADGMTGKSVRVEPTQETLKPGEGLEFKADLEADAPEGGKIEIVFAALAEPEEK